MSEFSDFFCKFWNSFEKISLQTIVCNLENWFIWSAVNCNNDFGIFHTSKMLNSSWNTTSNIKLRCNNFSCLSDLHFISTISRVNSSSWGSNCSITKSCSKIINDWEIFLWFKTSSTRNNDSGSCQIRFAWIWLFFFNKFREFFSRLIDNLNLGIVFSCRNFFKRRSSKSKEINILWRSDFSQSISSISGSDKGLLISNFKDISDGLGNILSCNSWNDIFTKTAAKSDNIFVLVFFMELWNDVGDLITKWLFGFYSDDLFTYFSRDRFFNGIDNFGLVISKDKKMLFIFKFISSWENFQSVAGEFFSIMFSKYQGGEGIFDQLTEDHLLE